MKKITSRDNPRFKELRDIARNAQQQRPGGRTVIDGPHLVAAYYHAIGLPRLLVVSDEGTAHAEVADLLRRHAGTEVLQLSVPLFRELSGTASPVGILGVIEVPPMPVEAVAGSCIVLDGIQDSGNLGSLLRTAAAAEIRDAIIGPGCAVPWSPKVLRAGQGAHFLLRIRHEADPAGFISRFNGKSVATVARQATPLFECDLTGKLAWIFGSEGRGIRPELEQLADLRVSIPMAENCESLNVGAAAAVCLFEAVRQGRRN